MKHYLDFVAMDTRQMTHAGRQMQVNMCLTLHDRRTGLSTGLNLSEILADILPGGKLMDF